MDEPTNEPAGLADRLDDLVLRMEAWCQQARPAIAAAAVLAALAALGGWLVVASTGSAPPTEDLIPLAPTPSSPPGAPGPEDDDPGPSGGTDTTPVAEASEVVVHVVGAVHRPGLVTLSPGARVSEAVAGAGGPLITAELERLNLATVVVDGMQIRVPALGEEIDGAGPTGPLIRLPPGGSSADGPEGAAGSGPIDLNRASSEQLQSLPGIGPALAAAIIEWRTSSGGFATIEELDEVPGIGPATLASLRDLVVV